MQTVKIKDEYIKLGQVLKLARFVSSGVEAKEVILDGQVKVNGEVCLMRGKKIVAGDAVSFDGKTMKVEN